jgi:AmmeMemoRadiSam system protein B
MIGISNMSAFNKKRIRPPAVAGRFYPEDPGELRRMVEDFLADALTSEGPAPKAIVVPHAGYPYSGPIAASAYARLRAARDEIRRIVLIGPSHYVGCDGLALSSAEAWATPLGLVPVDTEAQQQLEALPQVSVLDKAHAREHALEVQLPFLQVVLDNFSIVPLVVGMADPEKVSQALESLWGGPETRLVISSDLSHYNEPETACGLDATTARAIERLELEAVGENHACGRIPLCGLLGSAHRHKLRARTVDLRNSGDTGGPRSTVVGYGAFVFEEPEG